MKNLAIIPARSGSKGLPDKNIINLCGKPMFHYTIEAAIDSGEFDYVMVSTDSELYAGLAEKAGAKVPFLRSPKTSNDYASSWDVVREVLKELNKRNYHFDTVTLLQPTSPLRDKYDIKKAFQLYNEKNAKAVVSVCEVEHPVEWTFHLDNSLSMKEYSTSNYRMLRRQDIKQRYIENGAIYIVDVDVVMNGDSDIYQDGCYAYIMEKERSYDVDGPFDIFMVDNVMKYYINKSE